MLAQQTIILKQHMHHKYRHKTIYTSNPAEAVGFLRMKKSSARLPSVGK